MTTSRRLVTLTLVSLVAMRGAPGAATPIADGGTPTSLPAYVGAPATPHLLRAKKPPTNPFMARRGVSNVHDDSWMSDAYWVPGPLGRNPATLSSALGQRICVTITFDRKGRLVATCSNLSGAHLYMLDPTTLDVLAEMDLPFVPPPPGQDPFTNSAGGAYFYLDNQDRAVVGTATGHLWIVGETKGTPGFVLEQDVDVSAALAGDRITSVLPDWSGRLWFVGRYDGVIGIVDQRTGTIQSTTLGEEIENSFAVDRDGVYIVSDVAMYRVWADVDQPPAIVWSSTYQNSGVHKPGQFNAGSGTTPTLMDGGYVAIADNADPMNVVVYRKDAALAAGESRVVCEVPVFDAGAGATENSLVGAGGSLVVENNYGYQITTTTNGAITAPGVSRIDVRPDGSGCDLVWTSAERAPSVVPKLSTKTGLIYLFTKDPDPVNTTSDAWFWTALDFRTGETVWKQLAGTGLDFNNHYAGIVVGRRTRTAYLGVIGGIAAIREGD
jgi:hypothetical protein